MLYKESDACCHVIQSFMKLVPESVLKVAQGLLYKTFLHSFDKTLYYMISRVRSSISNMKHSSGEYKSSFREGSAEQNHPTKPYCTVNATLQNECKLSQNPVIYFQTQCSIDTDFVLKEVFHNVFANLANEQTNTANKTQ